MVKQYPRPQDWGALTDAGRDKRICDTVLCPYCLARTGQPCTRLRGRAIGTPVSQPHDVRWNAFWAYSRRVILIEEDAW